MDVNYLVTSTDPVTLLVFDKEMILELSNNQISNDIYESSASFCQILKESDYNNGAVYLLNNYICISFWYIGKRDRFYAQNYKIDLIEFKRLCEDGCIVEVEKPYDCKDVQSLIRRN